MLVFTSFSSKVILNVSSLELSTKISRGCCQTTHGIGGIFFFWSPVCQSLFRSENVAFLAEMLGCSPDTTSYAALCVLLLRFALRGKWHVYCIGSTITSLCGVVLFATCLTSCVDSSRFSVTFVSVGVAVVCVTVDSSGIIFFALKLLFVRHSAHLSFIRIFQTVHL